MAGFKHSKVAVGALLTVLAVSGVAIAANAASDSRITTTTTSMTTSTSLATQAPTTTSTSTTLISTTPGPSPTAAPTTTSERPKPPTTTTKVSSQFELVAKAPTAAQVGTTQSVEVSFRNVGPELDGGFTLETKLLDSAGKLVSHSGTGGLMPTGFTITDTIWLACSPLSEEAKASPGVPLEGPCNAGVYRLTQSVSYKGKLITQKTTATIRFTV